MTMLSIETSRFDRSACGCVVVTYRPDQEFEARFDAMAKEFERVVMVDNSASSAPAERLEEIRRRTGCTLLINASNLGIAAALNLGFSELARHGCEWAVAFDQDSVPEPGFLGQLLDCARRFQSTPRAAVVIGANWIDQGRPDHPSLHLQPRPLCRPLFRRVPAVGCDLDEVTCVITSGSLFHLPAWRAIGGFDESLFLDLVDAEYCLRARRHGLRVCVSAQARLRHHRGSKREVRFLGATWWPAFMPPLRLRCLFRNRLLVARRYVWREPHWVAFEAAFAAKILAEIVFLQDGKMAKLAACFGGTWDGIRGRRGAIAPPAAILGR